MKYSIISGIFLLLETLIVADPSCKSSPCISVDIYYESKCSDSIYFFENQLAPAYPDLKDHLHITFVPYGKATHKRGHTGNWIFKCQHGSKECKGNKAQACALQVIRETSLPENKQEVSVNLVNCVMSKTKPEYAVRQCAEDIGMSASARSAINNCFHSSVGNDLLAAHGQKTHSLQPQIDFIPTVIINEEYLDQPSEAFYDFKLVICNLLKKEGLDLASC